MGEGTVFSLLVHTSIGRGGGGYPIWLMVLHPRSGWGAGGVPCHRGRWGGGIPHPRSRWTGVPHPRSGQEVPHPANGRGLTPISSLDFGGYPILLTDQDGVTPPPLHRNWMGYLPCPDWMGHPPPPTPARQETDQHRALATRREVCLLRSRSRTFLCIIVSPFPLLLQPYICTQCGKTFAQSNACKQHYNTHHPGLEYKAKRIDKPEKIPTALLEDGKDQCSSVSSKMGSVVNKKWKEIFCRCKV